MLTFSHPGSRIQGSKRHPISDPGSGSATLLITTPHGTVQSSFTILRLLCFQFRSRDIDLDPIKIIFACWWTPSARQSYFFLTLQALKTFEMDTIPCGLTDSDQDPGQNPICSNITKLNSYNPPPPQPALPRRVKLKAEFVHLCRKIWTKAFKFIPYRFGADTVP